MEKTKLTAKDRKLLIEEKRWGIVLAVFIVSFGAIGITAYCLTKSDCNGISSFVLGVLSLAMVVYYLTNRKYIDDLNKNEKIIKKEILTDKALVEDVEAGSGHLRNEMRKTIKPTFLIDGALYVVEMELYEQVEIGDDVQLHFSTCSGTLLKIEPIPKF